MALTRDATVSIKYFTMISWPISVIYAEITLTLKFQGQDLVIGNLGDSRAVLATRDKDNTLLAVQLTVDLKPDLPSTLSLSLCCCVCFCPVHLANFFPVLMENENVINEVEGRRQWKDHHDKNTQIYVANPKQEKLWTNERNSLFQSFGVTKFFSR